ncbi:MAG: GIY-YIG nuclease family protein [FCB group bacterium]|nr:GIY-YIG nuclease family protein [FCB group bacterium]
MGVYGITSVRDGTIYMSFSTDLRATLNRHKAELRFGSHRTKALQDAWRLLGEPGLTFEVLDVLEHKEKSTTTPAEELTVLLEMWIGKLEREGRSVVTLQPARSSRIGTGEGAK